MGVDIAGVADTYAKKERARKRFQDKQTRKALVAFVASGTHREVVVKKVTKLNLVSICMLSMDGCMHYACIIIPLSQEI